MRHEVRSIVGPAGEWCASIVIDLSIHEHELARQQQHLGQLLPGRELGSSSTVRMPPAPVSAAEVPFDRCDKLDAQAELVGLGRPAEHAA